MKMCSAARLVVFIAVGALSSVQSHGQTAEPVSAQMAEPALKQTPDDSLKIYAVQIVQIRPFKEPSVGDGIYLGRGVVITAAHVVSRWPFFIFHAYERACWRTRPRLASQTYQARII